jgi:hypothetical protein
VVGQISEFRGNNKGRVRLPVVDTSIPQIDPSGGDEAA